MKASVGSFPVKSFQYLSTTWEGPMILKQESVRAPLPLYSRGKKISKLIRPWERLLPKSAVKRRLRVSMFSFIFFCMNMYLGMWTEGGHQERRVWMFHQLTLKNSWTPFMFYDDCMHMSESPEMRLSYLHPYLHTSSPMRMFQRSLEGKGIRNFHRPSSLSAGHRNLSGIWREKRKATTPQSSSPFLYYE